MKRFFWLVLFVCVLGSSGSGQEILRELPVDPADGVVDDRLGRAFLPAPGMKKGVYFDPTGFEVHLVPMDDPDTELVYPAGQFVFPPLDRYNYWVEGPGWMSGFRGQFNHLSGEARGLERGPISVVPQIPAGIVRLANGVPILPSQQLRLLHLESHNTTAPYPQYSMIRRVRPPAAREGVRMPAGPVVGLMYDGRSGEYLALSGPLEVPARGTTSIAPRPPADHASHLVVILNRAVHAPKLEDYDQQVTLLGVGEQPRPPDVFVPTPFRSFAFWYDLEARSAELRLDSRRERLAPTTIPLRPGHVEHRIIELQPLPGLDVDLVLPEALEDEELHLAALDRQGEEVVATTLSPGTTHHRFAGLPAEELLLRLDARPWRFLEEADLSSGEDGHVMFRPPTLEVSGRVFRGDDGHPATVRFQTAYDEGFDAVGETDDEGHYRVLLHREDVYLVKVELEDRPGPPFLEMTQDPLRDGDVLDLHVPANLLRVEVVDRESGEPLEGARVTADNAAGDGRSTSQVASTGESGTAELPPLRVGEVTLRAALEGYLPAEPRTLPVTAAAATRTVRLELEPEGPGLPVAVRLADGRPAGGAELRVQSVLHVPGSRWRGTADAGGAAALPAKLAAGWLLVRHPDGASRVLALDPAAAAIPDQPLEVVLEPAAAPLTVEVLDAGGEPLPWARLMVLLPGPQDLRLHGDSLAWLVYSRGATGRDGRWRAAGLPPHSLSLLAFPLGPLAPEALAGAYDALAETVSPPWPEPVRVRVVD